MIFQVHRSQIPDSTSNPKRIHKQQNFSLAMEFTYLAALLLSHFVAAQGMILILIFPSSLRDN